MRKRLGIIALAIIGALSITGCGKTNNDIEPTPDVKEEKDNNDKPTPKSEDNPSIEPIHVENTKEESIKVDLNHVFGNLEFIHQFDLQPMYEFDLILKVKYTGKYVIDFRHDLDIKLNDETVTTVDGKVSVLLKENETYTFNITNNTDDRKMGYLTFDLSTDTKNITVEDSYMVHIQNDTDKKHVSFNGDVELISIYGFPSNSLNDYYLLIKNKSDKPQTSDLIFESVESIELDAEVVVPKEKSKLVSFEIKESGFYKVYVKVKDTKNIDYTASSEEFMVRYSKEGEEFYYFFNEGTNYFGFTQEENEEVSINVSKYIDGELYINGKLYDGSPVFRRGESVEIEYYENGLSGIDVYGTTPSFHVLKPEGNKKIYQVPKNAVLYGHIYMYLKYDDSSSKTLLFKLMLEELNPTLENYTYDGLKGVKVSVDTSEFNDNEEPVFEGYFNYGKGGNGYPIESEHADCVLGTIGITCYSLGNGEYFFPVDKDLFEKYGATFHFVKFGIKGESCYKYCDTFEEQTIVVE